MWRGGAPLHKIVKGSNELEKFELVRDHRLLLNIDVYYRSAEIAKPSVGRKQN